MGKCSSVAEFWLADESLFMLLKSQLPSSVSVSVKCVLRHSTYMPTTAWYRS